MRLSILFSVLFSAFFAAVNLSAEPIIDDTPTRVQTTLQTGLKRLGTIRPKSVSEIETSKITLGCVVLDREYGDYDECKEYIAPLGIKRIRLQGGWARTERIKGKYDFAWLDHIIDDARSRGLEIWLETDYGNPLYPGGGGLTLGDGLPVSEEALKAWDNWVEAMAIRYKDKVRDWAMWNEPDLNGANSVEKVALFNIRTAEIIKRIIPDARIGAFVVSAVVPKWFDDALKIIADREKLDLFHWVVYHTYTLNPDTFTFNGKVQKIEEVIRKYSPTMQLWQGESGAQSEFCVSGAISKYPWTELTQAKWNTRRMLGDLGFGVDTCLLVLWDMDYRTTNFHNGLCRYGLLKTAGASQGFKVLKVKMTYFAVQNLVSLFNDSVELIKDSKLDVQGIEKPAAFLFKNKKSGSPLLVFWNGKDIPSDKNETVPVTITAGGIAFESLVWVDLITGNVYEFPKENISVKDGRTVITNVPIYDAPAVLMEKSETAYDVYPPPLP